MLKKITSNRNSSHLNFQKGLSFSIYPSAVIVPMGFAGIGFIKKDTSLMQTGLCMISALALNSAISLGLKYTINRERPYKTHPEISAFSTEATPSFPSGHTGTAFNLATSLTLFFPKWYVAIPSYAWASGIAYSRMYLGVHYPSDVLVGALIGCGTSWLTYHINKRYFKNYTKK